VTIVFFYICERFLVIVINEGVHFLYLWAFSSRFTYLNASR
jgi:hypothetical protein